MPPRKPSIEALLAAAEATRGQSLSKRVAARRALLARAAETRREPTVEAVRDPQFPELYADPRLAAKAASLFVAPESPHLKSLFGVTREDLTNLALSRDSGVWRPPAAPANPRGTEHARLLMTPDNAARLRETVRIGLEDPYLRSMAGWYPMDPAYERMVELLGPADAQIQYDRLNNLIGAHSIRSSVDKELSRGTAAYFLDQQGRFPEWLELGANPSRIRGVETAPGTMAHDVQSQVAGAYLAHGKHAGSAKVPAYIAASAAPDYGWQNQFAVGDAHFSRQIGLPDIRRATGGIDNNWTMPEALDINPWFRREVAHRVGVNPVSAQATLWGTLSPVTGVNTPIGAPKLEILADLIATKTAPRLGISPERARDLVLTGKTYAGAAAGAATVPTVPYLLQQLEEEERRGRIQ